MKIKFNDLNAQWKIIKESCEKDINLLFQNSDFILGEKVLDFESNFSKFCNVKYSIGVSSGTDAIKLAGLSLIEDTLSKNILIFIPVNTFIATYIGLKDAFPNAKFILIDCDDFYQIDTNILEEQVLKNRKDFNHCIIAPVHLYGYTANMSKIKQISKKNNCFILEDSSQAHGAIDDENNLAGSTGDVSAFSLYPGKNLGAAGDAGIITTNNLKIFEKIKLLRNYGSVKKYSHEIFGFNYRLDTMQAIILNQKLKFLNEWNSKRRLIINEICLNVSNQKIIMPQTPNYCKIPAHHIFPVRVKDRENFINYLNNNLIENGIHYPVPLNKLDFIKADFISNNKSNIFCDELVSLPIHPFISHLEIEKIISILQKY
ncbi:MAG: aminotransferase [Caulobacteraceae bacterium]|nr:aminotransferase [Caulobacteraceae bacterium]